MSNSGVVDVDTKPAGAGSVSVPGLGTFPLRTGPTIAPDGTVLLGTLEGKVRTADVRSPYDSRIELEWSDGRWTIIGFGSGI